MRTSFNCHGKIEQWRQQPMWYHSVSLRYERNNWLNVLCPDVRGKYMNWMPQCVVDANVMCNCAYYFCFRKHSRTNRHTQNINARAHMRISDIILCSPFIVLLFMIFEYYNKYSDVNKYENKRGKFIVHGTAAVLLRGCVCMLLCYSISFRQSTSALFPICAMWWRTGLFGAKWEKQKLRARIIFQSNSYNPRGFPMIYLKHIYRWYGYLYVWLFVCL